MYAYRHWHQFIPFSVILMGLYIGQRFKPATYDVVVTVFAIETGAILWWIYLVVAGIMYQAYITGWGTERKKEEAPPETTGELIDWNTGQVIRRTPPTLTAMAQTVDVPKVDNERRVARTLIDQRNHNMEVDLTEAFWIKRGNFGESREKFVAMKDNWRRKGVIRKAGDRKNAPDEVADWRKVRLIAEGNRLPN